jgi:hypothetical protein
MLELGIDFNMAGYTIIVPILGRPSKEESRHGANFRTHSGHCSV